MANQENPDSKNSPNGVIPGSVKVLYDGRVIRTVTLSQFWTILVAAISVTFAVTTGMNSMKLDTILKELERNDTINEQQTNRIDSIREAQVAVLTKQSAFEKTFESINIKLDRLIENNK